MSKAAAGAPPIDQADRALPVGGHVIRSGDRLRGAGLAIDAAGERAGDSAFPVRDQQSAIILGGAGADDRATEDRAEAALDQATADAPCLGAADGGEEHENREWNETCFLQPGIFLYGRAERAAIATA